MKTFELTVFAQNRILISVLLFGCSAPASLLIGLELSAQKELFWIISLPVFLVINLCLFYYCKGDLTVRSDNDRLIFKWKRKLLFRYKSIDPVNENAIETIVVDQKELLKAIWTENGITKISTTKLFRKDSQRFINHLADLIKQNNGEMIDSWDVWRIKGYLKWAMRINAVVIVGSVVIIGAYAIFKGFDNVPPASLGMLIFLIPQMLLYQMQMKKK